MGLVENNIKELSIPAIAKESFRINGDPDKILKLNTSDMNVISRLNEAYPKLLEYAEKVADVGDIKAESTEEELQKMADKLDEIDKAMKNEIDYIFDSNVSEICVGNGNIYDPKDGKFTWEHIIEAIGDLYKVSFDEEFDKLKKRVQKHTDKYTKSSKTKSTKTRK